MKNARWSVGSRSTEKSLTETSRSRWAMPTRVPPTETCEPSARVPRIVIRLRWSGLSVSATQADRGAALGREQRRVDVGDGVLDDVGEDSLEGGQLEHLHVVLGDLAAHLDVDLLGDLAGQRGEDPAELLGQRDAGPDVLGDHAALDVDGVGHQLAAQREPHRLGDRDARPSPGPRRSTRPGGAWRRRSRARTAGCRCTAPWRRRRPRRRRSGPP